ncbi:MAG TPA: hypothetical protein VKQ06_12860 [Gammaproteobacteria bacterium]|nr:hypothetical protein [Gammaproteobacteria bacterium]
MMLIFFPMLASANMLVVVLACDHLGGAPRACVSRARAPRVLLADGPEASATLLGGTVSFVFLYDPNDETVSIHPYDNILRVRAAATEAPD